MDFSTLRIFITVAQEKSVSRAAAVANCVQSNVTQRIKKLEDELGVPLFYRKSRGMVLTPEGEILLNHAHDLINHHDRAVRAVQYGVKDAPSLSIGSIETVVARYLPNILIRYQQLYPEARLSVHADTTHDLVSQVLKGKHDCALVGSPIDHEELSFLSFIREKLVLVHRKDDFQHETLLVYRKGCAYRARAEEWLRRSGRLPYKVMELGTQEGIIGCVRAGMGMTLLPEAVALKFVDEVEFTPLPEDMAWIDVNFIFRKDRQEDKAIQNFCAILKETYPLADVA